MGKKIRKKKKVVVTIFTSDKIDFKIKTVIRQRTLHNDPGTNLRRHHY